MKNKDDFVIRLLINKGYTDYCSALKDNGIISSNFETIEEKDLIILGILNARDRQGILKELKNATEAFNQYLQKKKKREAIYHWFSNISFHRVAIVIYFLLIVAIVFGWPLIDPEVDVKDTAGRILVYAFFLAIFHVWICTIIHCIRSNRSILAKVILLLVIVVGHVMGIAIYWIFDQVSNT
jgi:hypothetical protein